jgi:hypothetical protein
MTYDYIIRLPYFIYYLLPEGNELTIFSYALPEDQFDSLNNKLSDIIDSYEVNPDAKLN